MNKIILKGRLTNDPEQRYINEEQFVVSFSIAVNKKKKEEVNFFNIAVWNKTGEFVKNYFSKGQEILIVGRLDTNQYVDKDSHKKITSYIVVAEEVEFVGSKKEKQEENFDYEPEQVNFDNDTDLPF